MLTHNMPIVALLICLMFFISPSQAELLQGGIEHRQYMPQMPTELQAGSTYQAVQSQATSIHWYPLPKWLSGKYESDFMFNQVVQIYSQAAPSHASSGPMKHIENFGLQPDSTGRLWHADILPKTSAWEGARENLQTTVEKECVTTNDEKMVLHIHNQSVTLDPSRQRVIYSEQVDGYKTITLENDAGDISVYDDIQEYDSNGGPLDRYIAKYSMRRIEDFAPISEESGIDLRASLAQYLASINRPDLIWTVNNVSTPKSDDAVDGNTNSQRNVD